PRPWEPAGAAAWAEGLTGRFETYWLSDGLARDGRAATLAALEARGPVTVFEGIRPLYALAPPRFDGGAIGLAAQRLAVPEGASVAVTARGPDPAGIERDLATVSLNFLASNTGAEAALDLPPELRNRITRFEVAGERSAASVQLADDSLRRRKVALIGQTEGREALQLLSPVHYLRQALAPVADLIDGSLTDVLLASPDVVVLADVARLSGDEAAAVQAWVERGGLLLRFAGPRLAASDVSRAEEDPLLPVRLREGGRTVGGAMTWGEPKRLAPFPDGSPFFGLAVPDEVTVSAQVLAQPDPSLGGRTIAALADGTPLVTRKAVGSGQVVLVHVTANAEWSSLPLSVLFVQMLERLAVAARVGGLGAGDLAGTTWVPVSLIDAFGQVGEAGQMAGVPGAALAAALADGRPGPETPPGVYAAGDRRIALNVIAPGTEIARAVWPARVPVEGLGVVPERGLKGAVLTAAMAMLLLDILAALWVSGRLIGARAAAVVLIGLATVPVPGRAEDAFAVQATTNVVLAHVVTGDPGVDRVAAAGLR
ncbi:MAG: LytTR family transcriptional regulator, partial [Gemmobacter sp.]